MRRKLRKLILLAPLVIVAMLVFVAIGGALVQQLWNWLLPALFGWPQVSFWQALGLLALCRILFGGFGLHGSGRSRFRHRLAERWECMSPEERERIRHGLGGHPGFGRPAGESEAQ